MYLLSKDTYFYRIKYRLDALIGIKVFFYIKYA